RCRNHLPRPHHSVHMNHSTATMPSTSLLQGLEFLRSEAVNAHLSGDGIRVLHVCQTAIDYLLGTTQPHSQLLFEHARWLFSFYLYWTIDAVGLHQAQQAIGKVTITDDSRADNLLLTQVLE